MATTSIREELLQELLRGAPLRVPRPVEYLHLAVLSDGDDFDDQLSRFIRFCRSAGFEAPKTSMKRNVVSNDQAQLLWEQHSEFAGYTFASANAGVDLMDIVQPLMRAVGDRAIAASQVRIMVLPGTLQERDALVLHELGQQACGGSVCDGKASIWTDFEISPTGYTKYLILDSGIAAGRMSRLVKRLLDMDTYRVMAMRAFPIAQYNLETLVSAERVLASVVQDLEDAISDLQYESCLAKLLELARTVSALSVKTGTRFGASRAYHDIVCRRLEHLKKQRIQGYQRCSVFLTERLSPAVKTCEIVSDRIDVLTRNLRQATAMVRTHTDLNIQQQNKEQLRVMNARLQQQLRLQQAVEGLSIMAISYYAMGLVSLVLKGADDIGLPIDLPIATAALVPVVVLTI